MKTVGDGAARVAALRPGTRALIEGPYGRMTADTYTGGKVTMLACGVGVTPLLALLWDLPYRHAKATPRLPHPPLRRGGVPDRAGMARARPGRPPRCARRPSSSARLLATGRVRRLQRR